MISASPEDNLANRNYASMRINIENLLDRYGQASDDYANDLRQSITDYELMKINQSYLLNVAPILKRLAKIFNFKNIHKAACCFEAAAWAYLDRSDKLAFDRGRDCRFDLSRKNSEFFRSRLNAAGERAKRIHELYEEEFKGTLHPEISSLRFLLDLVLVLPIGAWECAPCLAMAGNCRECGYGQDHGICSQPGSTYDMLRSSREAMLKNIRRKMTELRSNLGMSSIENDLKQEHKIEIYSIRALPMAQLEIDICGQYDIVEACD
jgi:hypothetical protein